jgi:hypothetical protein
MLRPQSALVVAGHALPERINGRAAERAGALRSAMRRNYSRSRHRAVIAVTGMRNLLCVSKLTFEVGCRRISPGAREKYSNQSALVATGQALPERIDGLASAGQRMMLDPDFLFANRLAWS